GKLSNRGGKGQGKLPLEERGDAKIHSLSPQRQMASALLSVAAPSLPAAQRRRGGGARSRGEVPAMDAAARGRRRLVQRRGGDAAWSPLLPISSIRWQPCV
ncbi:unnamed protein product, partial [Urochloa humidicola]